MFVVRRFSDDDDDGVAISDIPVEENPVLPKPRLPNDTGQSPDAIVVAMEFFVLIERKVEFGLLLLNPPGVETTGNRAADSKP